MSKDGEIWHTDPVTLRDVLLDRAQVESRLDDCPELEKVWVLLLLGREEEAVAAGRLLLVARVTGSGRCSS
ncbi:hypothetical protein [Arthrobacter rhizosphaerae]|uniref:hypothetical protein n=1 Tax=Arthrobacter rhizosphaerae TaxID=2855490 RepID=UPI001FF44E97|nr:hypothetical protein [Arthrobacter rhizosphaerae]